MFQVFQVRKPLVLGAPGVPQHVVPHPVAVVTGDQTNFDGHAHFIQGGVPQALPVKFSATALPYVVVGDQTNVDGTAKFIRGGAPYRQPPPLPVAIKALGDQTNVDGFAQFVQSGLPSSLIPVMAPQPIIVTGDQTNVEGRASFIPHAPGQPIGVAPRSVSIIVGDQTYFDVPPLWLTPITTTAVPPSGKSLGNRCLLVRTPSVPSTLQRVASPNATLERIPPPTYSTVTSTLARIPPTC
jgi:hypothetical protein